MSAADLMLKPVPELAALVRGGEISAREVVGAALRRIEDLDDRINAFIEVDDVRALAAADEIQPGDERPFAGVPIAIKANVPVAGCGLIGLKPSRGRVSRGPDLGDSFLVSDGVLTRTVAETAGLLDVLAGYEVGDATWAARPVDPYATAVRRDPGRLRIAMTAENPLGVDVDPECVRGMHQAGELLASLGHEVEHAAPAMPGRDALGLFIQAFGPAVALGIGYGELLAGRPPEDDEIEPLSRAILELAQNLSSIGYLGAVAQLQALARGLVAFFAEYDLLLTPALAERPLKIGDCTGYGDDPMADLARSGRFTPFTSLFNVTGQPAISVPLGFGDDGLPTAAQLVAKPLGEDTLLQVAAQMEAALGKPAQIPGL